MRKRFHVVAKSSGKEPETPQPKMEETQPEMENFNLNLESLKGKEIKSVEVRTDIAESEVLYITFKDGKVLKVYANGCPEFGYALHLSLINQNQKVGI
jgi:hypothetical protein